MGERVVPIQQDYGRGERFSALFVSVPHVETFRWAVSTSAQKLLPLHAKTRLREKGRALRDHFPDATEPPVDVPDAWFAHDTER